MTRSTRRRLATPWSSSRLRRLCQASLRALQGDVQADCVPELESPRQWERSCKHARHALQELHEEEMTQVVAARLAVPFYLRLPAGFFVAWEPETGSCLVLNFRRIGELSFAGTSTLVSERSLI